MTLKFPVLYKIFYIDRQAGREESIISPKVTWNIDGSILNIVIEIPTKKGVASNDFQIPREDFISMDVYRPILRKKNAMNANYGYYSNQEWNSNRV